MYKVLKITITLCIAGAIRELCEAGDSGVPQFIDATQLNSMIDNLCSN